MRIRILCFFLSIVMLLCMIPSGSISVSAATAEPIVRYCEFCDLTEEWQPLTDNTVTFTTGHYYLTKAIVFGVKNIKAGNTVCIDLNGKKWTHNRHMIVEKGGIVNIQDTVGGGSFIGRGIDQNDDGTYDPGRAIWLKAGGTLNLYNGTMTAGSNGSFNASRGGVIAAYGTFNMYGGTVKDGIATDLGGTIYVDSTGTFNMYGGTVSGGSAKNARCIYSRGKVLLSGNASIEHIQLTPKPEADVLRSNQLTIQGAYNGSVCLSPYGVTESNVDIGDSINADLSNANIYFEESDLKLAVSGTDLITYLPKTANIVENGVVQGSYDTLTEAVSNVQVGQTIVLYTGTDEAVTIDKSITLDLNGKTIANTLTAAEGVTVQVMDTTTADYSIADGIYGKIQAIAGDIRPAEATESSVPYLQISEETGISYHAVSLNIDSVTLRPGDAALYYNNTFKGDQLVAEKVASFGIALSVVAAPETEIMGSDALYSTFEASTFGSTSSTSSTLLTNIMRTENSTSINRRNAELPVYGRAYIQLTDGSYLFGCCRSISLKDILEQASAGFASLSVTQRDGLLRLYNTFADTFDRLGLNDIKDAAIKYEEETLKIIVIGNSHSIDALNLLYKVFKDQNPEQNIVLGVMYYSGCSIVQHVKFANSKSPVYDYRLNIDGTWVKYKESTLQDGLTDQQWDLVFMQAGTKDSDSTFNKSGRDELKAIIDECVTTPYTLGWHTTWAPPNDETFYAKDFDPQPSAGWEERYRNLYDFDIVKYTTAMMNQVTTNILPDPMYKVHIGISSAVMYAHLNLGIPQTDLYRDYAHLSDFGRLIAAYCWYSQLTGEEITQVNIDLLPAAERATFRQQALGDMTVTDEMKAIIIESVNYALDWENRWSVPVKAVTE